MFPNSCFWPVQQIVREVAKKVAQIQNGKGFFRQ